MKTTKPVADMVNCAVLAASVTCTVSVISQAKADDQEMPAPSLSSARPLVCAANNVSYEKAFW